MKRKCFNCGAILPLNSLKCKECGYVPDIEFMRKWYSVISLSISLIMYKIRSITLVLEDYIHPYLINSFSLNIA